MQVLREVHRVSEWRGDAIYRTEYVRDEWFDYDNLEVSITTLRNNGMVLAVKSTSFDGPTVRRGAPTNPTTP